MRCGSGTTMPVARAEVDELMLDLASVVKSTTGLKVFGPCCEPFASGGLSVLQPVAIILSRTSWVRPLFDGLLLGTLRRGIGPDTTARDDVEETDCWEIEPLLLEVENLR